MSHRTRPWVLCLEPDRAVWIRPAAKNKTESITCSYAWRQWHRDQDPTAHPLVESIQPWRDPTSTAGQTIHQDIVVMFDSDGSYFLDVSHDATEAKPTRQKLAMQCEEVLPLDAEEIEVDYQTTDSKRTIVAIETQPMAALVDTLEDAGFRVIEITPMLPTLIQSLQHSGKLEHNGFHLLSSRSGIHTEWTRTESGVLTSWSRLFVESPNQLVADAASDEIPLPDTICTQIIAPELQQQPLKMEPRPKRLQLDSLDRALISAATELAEGRLGSPFRLRRGHLARHDPLRSVRSDLNRLFVATAALWVTLCVGILWKTWLANSATDAADQQLIALFKESFPGQRVPAVIVRQFQTERSRLLTNRATSSSLMGSADGVKQPTDARDVLVPLVDAIPTDQAFQMESLRIDNGQFVLDVAIENHEAAVAIVDALRAAGVDTQSPTSERVAERKVTSRIRGRLRE